MQWSCNQGNTTKDICKTYQVKDKLFNVIMTPPPLSLSWHSVLTLNMYFKGEQIKKEDIKLKIWSQGIEKSLNCAKKAFLFLICVVFPQLSGLVGSLWKCFTASQFYFETFSELSDLDTNFERYEESVPTLLHSKKLYF